MCSVIQSDVPRRSIDKDMHCERIGQMGARKYLRKSCYHRIECSVTNSLAALMRKWYLNNSFQPYIYSLKTLRRCWGRSWCDKDQDQQSNLRVEGRDERKKIVKNRREVLRERDRGIKKRIIYKNWSPRIVLMTIFLDKTSLFLLYRHLDPL